MRQTLVLLFIICLSSCFGKTSRDLPRIEEAIENIQKHRQKLEQIRRYISDAMLDKDWKDEVNNIIKDSSKKELEAMFLSTINSSEDLIRALGRDEVFNSLFEVVN